MNEILLYLAAKYKGEWNRIYKAIKEKENILEEEFNNLIKSIKQDNFKFVSIIDKEYPKQLLNINKPPFVLFYEGNWEILSNAKKCVYLTGEYETEEIVKYIDRLENNEDYVFFSMFWNGLEKTILRKLLERKFKVVILLPSGIEYAKNNLNLDIFQNEKCLFLSEYPNNYHSTKEAFYARQRICACFCKKMILLSSLDQKYNSVINEFLDRGKDIECLIFKDHLNDDKNIELINQGATLISDKNEIC